MNCFRMVLVLFIICFLFSSGAVMAESGDDVKLTNTKKSNVAIDIDLTKNEFKSETKAGLIYMTGNTDSLSFNGSEYLLYRIKRFENKFNLGGYFYRVTDSPTGNTGTFAKYLYGTYRLDYYILPKTTLYLGGGAYGDDIIGVNVASLAFAGVAHYFTYKERTKFRVSLGYSHSYEDRVAPAADVHVHSANVVLYYEHDFNDRVSFVEETGIEQNVRTLSDFRFHDLSQLRVKMTKRLALAVSLDTRYDHQPVLGYEKWDTITDVSLILSF